MRAHVISPDTIAFEDPIRHVAVEVDVSGDDVMISDGESTMWMRASDAASVGDWLRRTFAAQDWRIGADPAHTSIPLDVQQQTVERYMDATAEWLKR